MALPLNRSPVENGVQRWIVIHLELSVEFKPSLSVRNSGPERGKAAGEIGALHLEKKQAVAVALPMGFVRIRTRCLLSGVESFKGEDGESIEDEAGCFGVQGGVGVLLDGCEQEQIDLLDEVVAPLIEAVDGALDDGDDRVGGSGVARLIFLVPELEVGPVFEENESLEFAAREGISGGIGRAAFVPPRGGLILQGREVSGVEHEVGVSCLSIAGCRGFGKLPHR